MHVPKKTLYEQDICTQYLVLALVQASWDLQRQMREEVTFARGRVIVRGKQHSRDQARCADLSVYHQPNRPLAVIDAQVNMLLRFWRYDCVTPSYALKYFLHCMYSGIFQKHAQQTTNIAYLSSGRLATIDFLLPPLEEQYLIGAKVDEFWGAIRSKLKWLGRRR